MDGSGPPQHNPHWEQLMPQYSGSSTTNQEYPWDRFSSTNAAPTQQDHAPSNSISAATVNPCRNHNRASQYRRRDLYSPQRSSTFETSPYDLPSHECYNTLPPPLPEPRNLQSDSSRQLPGIESLTQDFIPADFPTSDLSWGSFGDDSLFDGEFWPPFDNNQLDINFDNNINLDQSYLVDLTTDAPSPVTMPALTRKRRASGTASQVSPSSPSRIGKRQRADSSDVKRENPEVAHLDLVDVDDDGGLSKVLEQQQAAAIKEQQGLQGDVPTKLSNVQCIICMEPMTDMTVTHCGHIFCHTCIMEALIAGENQGEPGKGTSKCPVCRKKVARPKEKSRDKREVIPLEIKFVTRSSLAKGKAKA
ncbi:MAG: hypothetical protein Q9213_003586 [Squamulea squamosa]